MVLDPFVGAGTTAIAALMAGRRYVGFDDNPDYVVKAEKRINEYLVNKKLRTLS